MLSDNATSRYALRNRPAVIIVIKAVVEVPASWWVTKGLRITGVDTVHRVDSEAEWAAAAGHPSLRTTNLGVVRTGQDDC